MTKIVGFKNIPQFVSPVPRLVQLSLLMVLFCVAFSGVGNIAYADSKEFNFSTGCTQDDSGAYTAILDVQAPKNVYAKLGTRGEKLVVSAFQVNADLSGDCHLISSMEINGDSWTKMGTIFPGEGQVVLEIYSPELTSLPDASRPSVLLLDPTNPVCTPNIECDLTINNVPAYIEAPTTLHDKASLFVGIPEDPGASELVKVDYYASGSLVYSASTLKPFDMRYVSYAGQPLLRVAHYASGQQIVYPSKAPDGFKDNFLNLIYRSFGLGTVTSKILFALILFVVALLLIYWCMKLYVRHYRWLVYHGMMRMDTFKQRLGLYTEIMLERVDFALERFYNYRFVAWVHRNTKNLKYILIFWVLPLILVTSYFVVKNYGFILYHVNGESMTYTFKNGQALLVNELPQTIAHFNHQQMSLKRGDVVVVNAIYGLVSADQIQADQHIIVKRVLGLPGERVTVTNGVVRVYNEGNPNGIEVDKGAPWEPTMRKDTASTVKLDVQLGSDEIFLSGDNRPGSIDSRLNGPVKVDQIIGIVAAHW